jgi:hypothetical protein
MLLNRGVSLQKIPVGPLIRTHLMQILTFQPVIRAPCRMGHLTGWRGRRPRALISAVVDLVDRVFADGGRQGRR